MEYTINNLSKMAGISTRTLRYYDEIDLLKPQRISSNKYRIYGEKEVDLLQKILFYREIGMPLYDIKKIILSPEYDAKKELEKHLEDLILKQKHLNKLIYSVEKTILSIKGEYNMSNSEKFEAFKEKMVNDNEEKYGKEIREKYGDDAVNESNKKIRNMKKEEHEKAEKLRNEINELLREAVLTGDTSNDISRKLCETHKEWLCIYYDKYTKEYHLGLANMYVEDERFAKYYEDVIIGGAKFLREAIINYHK